ncbi:MAG: translation initiation factor IF-2 [Elusimicrobiota bacterium]
MKKKTTTKKTAKKTAKKAAPKSAGKKSTAKKKAKKSGSGIRRAQAENRSAQEEGSIAPPTTHLVDAFAKFRSTARRVAAPAVTRLPAGGSLPIPKPAPKPPEPVSKTTPAVPPTPPPATAPPPAAAPLPPAPLEQKPDAPAPIEPAESTEPENPAPPVPKATYKLDAAAMAARPRPVVPGQHEPSKKQKSARHRKRAEVKAELETMPTEARARAQGGAKTPDLKQLKVSTMLTLRELAEKMSISPNELIKKLMNQGVFATINQRLDSETAILVAHDYGYELDVVPMHMEEEIADVTEEKEKPENLKPRPCVVTVMGHVDHGKTKLLDAIRKTNVVAGESGGITQHIGAYRVGTPNGDITFLDTPGHAAFTAMRSRGTKVTDLVILVVSAVDGVMPQTVEALDHAKEAGVPIIVAVNKIDLPGANPQKIRTELATRGLNPEEWGGDTVYVDISAKQVLNIDKLLETILLQAEMLELKANPDRAAAGAVIEARMEKNAGTIATVLIQKGTVKIGDPFVMGLAGGKVKALVNDQGERIKSAGPSTPVEILGITGNIPQAGDGFSVVASERMAKEIIANRNRVHREEALAHKHHVSLLNISAGIEKELPVIIKADVQGSAEVLKDSLEKMSTDEIKVRVIHAGLGNANESDVLLAEASNAVILLFHVSADTRAKETAEKSGVEMRSYEILYELTADVRAALEGLLEPEEIEVSIGKVEVRQEFKIRGAKVAGSFVVAGKVVRGAHVKVLRDGDVIGESRIETLKRFKDDAKEVEKDHECGIALAAFHEWKPGDLFEIYTKEMRTRRLQTTT